MSAALAFAPLLVRVSVWALVMGAVWYLAFRYAPRGPR